MSAPRSGFGSWQRARIAIVVVFAGLCALRIVGVAGVVFPFSPEWSLYDLGVRHAFPQPSVSGNVVIVEVDDRSLDDLGERWPMSRSTWALFIDKLTKLRPAVIAIDAVFDQPGPRGELELGARLLARVQTPEDRAVIEQELAARDHDRALAEAIARSGIVVLGAIVRPLESGRVPRVSRDAWSRAIPIDADDVTLGGEDVIVSQPMFSVAARDNATLNIDVDRDGVLRRYPYLVRHNDRVYASLGLAAVAVARPERAAALAQHVGGLDGASPLLVFPAPSKVLRVRFSDLLLAPDDSPGLAAALRGRIVFVGVTASGLHEQITVPFDTTIPGVEIHAAAAEDLLLGTHVRTGGPAAWFGLLIALASLGGIAIACARAPTIQFAAAITGGVVVATLVGGYGLVVLVGWIIGIVPELIGAAALLVLEAVRRYLVVVDKRRQLEQEQRVTEEKSQFISVVSHELRTPITSIRGSLGLLKMGAAGDLPEEAGEMLDIAHSNTERLLRLINDVLDHQKMAAGKMELSLAPCSVRALLDETASANRGFADEFGVSLLVEMDEDVELNIDRDRIVQTLTNLISNGVKFSPKGAAVRIGGRATARDTVRIEVEDRGPGIPREFRDRIFGEFAQAKAPAGDRPKGTGLGLSIAKGIVEGHGGSIGFDTEVGSGTTFYFELPR